MFCINCGTKINDGDSFCTNCGAKVATSLEKEGELCYEKMFVDSFAKIKEMKCITDYENNTLVDKVDSISIGSFPHSEDIYGDIDWIILERDEKNHRALLLSKYILCEHKNYNEVEEDVTWETCSLRKWLNEYFLDNMFDDEEKKHIIKTKIVTNPNINYQSTGGNDVEDKIFCLSKEECIKYFNESNEGNIKLSTMCHSLYVRNARKNITIEDYDDWWGRNGRFWLRSSGFNQQYALQVENTGDIFNDGYRVIDDAAGVRPAMWINYE